MPKPFSLNLNFNRKYTTEDLFYDIEPSPLTTLMFNIYALNFLHVEKLENSQIVDYLWKDALQKTKSEYIPLLLNELKEEVETTQIPLTLTKLLHPRLEAWYKTKIITEQLREEYLKKAFESDSHNIQYQYIMDDSEQVMGEDASPEARKERLDKYCNDIFPKEYIGKHIWCFDWSHIQDASLDDYISLFSYAPWEEMYGGKAWADIALYTKKLSQATNPQEVMYLIDWINHMAHNSGSLLEKWIEDPKALLDAKAHPESLRLMYPYCSPDVKKLLRDYFRNHLRSGIARLRIVQAQLVQLLVN